MARGEKDTQQTLQSQWSIFEATPGFRLLLLPDASSFTILTASDEFCRTFHVARPDVVGRPMGDVVSPFEKPEQSKTGSIYSLEQALKCKCHHQLDSVALILNAGSAEPRRIHCDVMSIPVMNDEGEIAYIIHSFENILDEEKGKVTSVGFTKRKLRELRTRLEQTFAIETVGVIYFNLQGTINDANPAFEKMSGYSRADFRSGKVRWDVLTAPEFMDVTMISLNEFLTAWQNTPYEKQYIRPDGSRWWGLFAGKRLSENECVEFVLDISALKQIESELETRVQTRTLQLERANDELMRSNQNLEQFAYAASHDLKEPLRKILLFTDKLEHKLEDRLSEDEVMFFQRLVSATRRMSQLIDDLLSYSHATFQGHPMEAVDLNDLVTQVMTDLEIQIEEKEARVTVGKLPTINGHYRQLQQVFQNLISNAIKYSRPGITPEISIHGNMIHDSALVVDHYRIDVKDNGTGFHQNDAEKIFDVFVRLHTAEVYKGSGVGLSIVRKVVENHHGFVRAIGVPGEGSTFQLYFPITQLTNQDAV